MHCLWAYDYLLTLGDEVRSFLHFSADAPDPEVAQTQYAWKGRRSWIFALFIANRYTPVFHLIWSNAVMYNYTKPFCQDTKWLIIAHTTAITILAEITVALRVYAVTERNKWLAGVLSVLIAAQFGFGFFSMIRVAIHPLQPMPEINLDPFKFCVYKRWRLGELIFVNIAVAFDVLAFFTILTTAKKPGVDGHPDIPSILNTILRDATLYFVFMFLCQFLSQLFLFVTPDSIQLFPGL
ncbi:hypothetical protein BDM02DRAFT_3116882 [Thelephora ganbajun]|uniref:Uncharacterized protein n=1 Tax=Thelephora ganbajun TaxID=370292 RepID=A0ACB6ZD90_THEGA|nr:hypothetical protein BDM02DRAFT_3116882 [Thelephora ganbajun]